MSLALTRPKEGTRRPMQAKMASPSPLLKRAYQRFFSLWVPVFGWSVRHLPLGGRAGEIAVVYVPDRFEIIEAYRSAYRRRAGVTEIPVTNGPFSALGALRVLRSGGVVAVQGDRDFNDSGLALPFFGRTAW